MRASARRRLLLLTAVALPLAALDLLHKAVATTPEWAYHPRGIGWLVLAGCVVAGSLALVLVPSTAVSVFAGLLTAGTLGNGIASLAWEQGIPNPLVVETPGSLAAFNLADVSAVLGIATLTVTLAVVTIRNRGLLPPPRGLVGTLRGRRR